MWAWIALSGWIVFGLLAFGLRSWVQWRRTGSTGFRGFSGHGVERLGGVLFALAVALSLLSPLATLFGWVPAIADLAWPQAGLLVYGLGLSGTLWAQWTMGGSWRIGVDASESTALVTDGPFRWVRNPIFSAMAVCTLGLVLLVPSLLSITAFLFLIVGVELQVRWIEEPYLLRVHGQIYRAWADRVGRFVPLCGRGLADRSQP